MPYPTANLGFTGHIYNQLTLPLSHEIVSACLSSSSHDLYSYQYFLILITITTTSALLPYPSHPHPIRQHGGEVVPQATLENV